MTDRVLDLVTAPDTWEADCCAYGPHLDVLLMNLYCWPCKTVHEFGMKDVERIVYALGADAADRGPDANRVPTKDFIPSCPIEVLRWARDSEVYAEHVEQGIECRERSE